MGRGSHQGGRRPRSHSALNTLLSVLPCLLLPSYLFLYAAFHQPHVVVLPPPPDTEVVEALPFRSIHRFISIPFIPILLSFADSATLSRVLCVGEARLGRGATSEWHVLRSGGRRANLRTSG